MFLSEDIVQNQVINYLNQKGWSKNLKAKNLKEHGVDIKVRNNNFSRYWLIEVKGEASPNARYPKSHREVNFNLALGQIITRMWTKGKRNYKYRYKYGVAYPDSFKNIVLRRLPFDVCDKLNLHIFFVNQSGKVEEYNWKKLKQENILK